MIQVDFLFSLTVFSCWKLFQLFTFFGVEMTIFRPLWISSVEWYHSVWNSWFFDSKFCFYSLFWERAKEKLFDTETVFHWISILSNGLNHIHKYTIAATIRPVEIWMIYHCLKWLVAGLAIRYLRCMFKRLTHLKMEKWASNLGPNDKWNECIHLTEQREPKCIWIAVYQSIRHLLVADSKFLNEEKYERKHAVAQREIEKNNHCHLNRHMKCQQCCSL